MEAWKQEFFRYPSEMESICQHIMINAGTNNMYFSPSVFNQGSAKKEFFQATNLAWVEFDGNLPGNGSMESIPQPTIKIRSSSEDHEHWYWMFDGPVAEPNVVESINRALAYKLGADKSGWDINQVLRPPGTLNHKIGRPVSLLSQTSNRYSPAAFEKIPDPPRLVKSSVEINELPDVLNVVAKFAWSEEEFEFFKKRDIKDGSRSSALTRLAYICAEKRMSDEEAFAILIHADERWGKFKHRQDRMVRLLDLISYVRQKHPLNPQTGLDADGGYPIYGLRDFVETKIEVEWVIPDIIQKGGLLFFSGPPGTSKTTLSVEFGINMALGREFLGWSMGREAKIMILSLEMGHADLKHFVDQLIENLPPADIELLQANLHLIPIGHDISLDKGQEQKWLKAVVEKYQPDGIIIDSLSTTTADEISSEKVVKSILSPLSKLRAENGTFIWFIHHNRKAQADNKRPKKLADIFGSQYLTAQATTVIGLWPSGNNVEINALKIRLSKPFNTFIAQRVPGSLGFQKQDKETDKSILGHIHNEAVKNVTEPEKGPDFESAGDE
ncbi:MAG: AAA family ATPase [Chitinophagaceae bacterium]